MALIPHAILRDILESTEDKSERLAASVWLSRLFRPESLQLAVEACRPTERRLVEQHLIRRLMQVEYALELFNTQPLDLFARVLEDMQAVLEVPRLTTRVELSQAIGDLPDLVLVDDESLEDGVAELRTYEEPTYEMLLKTFSRATERVSQVRRLNSWLWESPRRLDELSRTACTDDAEKLGCVGDARCLNVLLVTRTPGGRTSAGSNFAEAARILGEDYLYLLSWLHPEHAEAALFVLGNMRSDDEYRMPSVADYLVDEAC
jgi:hypothetical protein